MKTLANYMNEECWEKHLQKMLSAKSSGTSINVVGVFEDDFPMDDDTVQLYLNRELPLHDGIMETNHIDFYRTADTTTRLEYILGRTFIIDELDAIHKYPEEYIIEFVTNFEAELDLFISYKDFDKLNEFTKDLFKSMLNYAQCYLSRLNQAKTSGTIESNIKKAHGIK